MERNFTGFSSHTIFKKGVVSELISVGNALFAKNKKWYGYLVQHCTYDRVGLVIFTKLEKESTLTAKETTLHFFPTIQQC